ncbi:MAG: hypothetical protein V1729_06385 [Candidatus Woesearchaeota archaeon]
MVNDKDSCTLKCNHCFLNYSGNRTPKDTSELIRTLKSQGFDIRLSGSELLSEEGYLDCIADSKREYVMTNGILLIRNPSLYDALSARGISEIRMSRHYGISSDLDSAPLDISSKVCKEAKQRGFKVGFMVVITQDNYQLIKHMCDDAHSLNADSVMLLNYAGSKRLSKDKRPELFDQVIEQRKIYSKDDLEIRIHGDFGPRPGSRGDELAAQNRYCPAGTEQFVITPAGDVFGCPLLMQYRIGRFEDGKIKIEKELVDGQRDCCLVDLIR